MSDNNAANVHMMYCVVCKDKRAITAPEQVAMRSNRAALKGKCPICDTTTFKIVSKSS